MTGSGHSAEHLRLIIDSATDFAIISADLEGRITSWNSGAERLIGYTEAEILGRPLAVFFTPEDQAAGGPDGEMRLALETGRAEDERWHQRKDGSRFWGSGLLMTLKDEAGEVIGFVKMFRDRTRQRETESALGAMTDGLRLAMEAGRLAIWNLDLVADTMVGSPELNRVLGFPLEAQPTLDEIRARYAPGELDRIRAVGAEALARGQQSIEAEFRYLWPGEVERWLMLRAEVQFAPDGRPLRAVGVLMDIDDRKRAHLALTESEARFRLIADQAPVMLWMGDTQGRCLYLNRSLREFWGVTEEAFATFDWNSTLHPDDVGMLSGPFSTGMRERTGFTVEARYRRADGAFRTLHTDAHPRFGAGGEFLGMIGVNVDVTDAREAEAALTRETRALELVNQAGVAVAAERDLGRIVDIVTAAGRELTGAQFGAFFYNVTNEQGESFMLYTLSGVEREAFAGFPMPRATAIFQPTFHGEGIIRSDDILADPRYGRSAPHHGMPRGHLPVRSYLAVPVTSRSGEVLGGLFYGHPEPGRFQPQHETVLSGIAGHAAIAIDNARLFQANHGELIQRRQAEEALQALNATLEQRVADEVAERAKAEEALRQSQKMEAVGQLTGGLAHDFNNILAGISGSLDLMATRIAQGRLVDVDRYMAAAQGAAKRAAALTHRLLAFSRRQTLQPKATDMNQLVGDMEELIRRTVGPAVEVETIASAGLWSTLVDPNQLENALLNLCINARDAMPDGGRIVIETGNRRLDDRAARDRDLVPGQYVSLCVSDNGTGMAPDVIEKAFDPFFTTKPIGQGTGLGLSMIYGFARQSGGHTRIYSEVGQGTTVCLYLPRHHAEASGEEPERLDTAPSTGSGETVLVIDDEPLVRMLVVDVLEELGYHALEAEDGPAGLKLLRSDARIDLLITDVGLPNGMNGRQVADAARELRPDLPVLFVTGYAENAVLSHGHLAPGMQVVTKPFDMDQLQRRIGEMVVRG